MSHTRLDSALPLRRELDPHQHALLCPMQAEFSGQYGNPAAAAGAVGTLTLLLASVLFIAGVFEIAAYFQIATASGWLLANGIVTLVLGGLIWFQWPSSSVWAIGLLVGVNLLMTGFTRLMLGAAGRRLVNRVAA